MKRLDDKFKKVSRIVFKFSFLLLLASCNNIDNATFDDVEEENEIVLTDAWICDMESFEEERWLYQMYLEDNGDYLAISETRILKVSKDGFLNSMIMLNYPDDNTHVIRVFNNQIYRFHYDNDFQNYDPSQPLQLQIYDFDFNLVSDHILDSSGLIYDVEIESDNLFGMLVYSPDESTMRLKKLDLTDGLVSEIILSTTGTSPGNLHILETGHYFCTASSSQNNLTLLDNDLNLLWAAPNNAYTVSDANYVPGQGIYITGRGTFIGNFDDMTIVALLDMDGNEINFVAFDAGDRWSPYMEINQGRICLAQSEPESQKNMLLTMLDLDLNIQSSLDIIGKQVFSDIIKNEIGSFSFVYGKSIDPNNTDFSSPSNTRIFKFDDTYTVPTNIIIQ